jgi:hypothetical protein
MEASCAASGVADVGKHRVARAPHRLQFGLVADHLHLQAIGLRRAGDDGGARAGGRVELLDRLGAAGAARRDDRTAVIAGAPPVLVARLEHVPAEAPHGLICGEAEQLHGLGVEVADGAILVDGVHAFDDAGEHRLRLRLAPSERTREIDEVAAHVLHGARQCPDFRRATGRDRGGEVPGPEAHGRGGERAHRARDEFAQHHPGKHRQRCEDEGGEQQLVHQVPRRGVHRRGRQQGRDERNGLTAGGEYRHARGIDFLRIDALHRRVPVGQGGGVQRRERIHRGTGIAAVVDEAHLRADLLAELVREPLIQAPHHIQGKSRIAQSRARPEQRHVLGRGQRHEAAALLGGGGHDLLPVERRA